MIPKGRERKVCKEGEELAIEPAGGSPETLAGCPSLCKWSPTSRLPSINNRGGVNCPLGVLSPNQGTLEG